jgi:hypothetical protein
VSKCILPCILNIKKSILVLVLVIDMTEQSTGCRKRVVDVEKDGLFRVKLDTLSNDVEKLSNRQVSRSQEFGLVNGGNRFVAGRRAFDNHWYSVRVRG